MPRKKDKPVKCLVRDHNYQANQFDDTERRKKDDGTTEIWRAVICTKCADVQMVKVSTWAAR